MKCNLGKYDRSGRIFIGIAMLAAGGYFQSYWGLVGLVPLFTALVGFCPLYVLFGFSSCPAGDSSKQKPAA